MVRKILMIIAPEQFRDEELLVPRKAFQSEGWLVDVVSTRTGEAKGMLGAVEKVEHDLDFAEEKMQKGSYDAIVIVGGMGSVEHLWDNEQIHQMLQTMNKQGRVVAAICLSGAVLAKAGLLKGKKATVWEMPESLQVFEENKVHYTGEPVTVDGNIITANGPDAANSFSRSVIAEVKTLSPV